MGKYVLSIDNKINGGPLRSLPSANAEKENETLYNADNIFPEILIISHPRSGTHLLESFLKSHSVINGKGVIIVRYEENGVMGKNKKSQINVGILMYEHISTFEKLGGILKKHKIIHLIRNSKDVALSILQMRADKIIQSTRYKAHYIEDEIIPKRGEINYSKKELLIMEKMIEYRQKKYSEELNRTGCLEITYESIAPGNKTNKELDKIITKKIFDYLEIKIDDNCVLRTKYIKTGING
ncbi:MAG: hypothetical protein ABFD76_08895 [Smithella sp.]